MTRPGPDAAAARLSPGAATLLLAAFLGVALWLYQPALDGPFLSDDVHYVEKNVHIHTLSLENVAVILDPNGATTIDVVNYSPVQLLIHAVAWNFFGSETTGHHVVNVVFHALASLLLVPLLLRSGLPLAAALFGGVSFLVHPANVEAVAWISQLKSSSAMALALASLLLFPRRRMLGTLLFCLALLAKPTAAFALPVAVLLAWSQEERVPWRWFAAWALVFAVFSIVEFSVHQRSGAVEATLYDSPLGLVLTVGALAARYVAMSATSLGVSAFHEPAPVAGVLDPWWLASLVAGALVAWRIVATARARRPELAYWVWALVSYGPVSQVFPFLYPLADRYLYFILPGLLGGALLAGQAAMVRLWPEASARRRAARVTLAAGVLLCAGFAVHAHRRAGIWKYSATLMADSARHYPDGVAANLIRTRTAAQQRDGAAAATALAAAAARGYNRFEQIYSDPGFDPVRQHPEFRAVVDEMAAGRIARVESREDPTQAELRMAAHAHIVRGEYDRAHAVLLRALAQGGARDDDIRRDLDQLSRVMR